MLIGVLKIITLLVPIFGGIALGAYADYINEKRQKKSSKSYQK